MVLSIKESEQIFDEAKNKSIERSYVRWTLHSQVVAECAKKIASKIVGLNPDKAYSLGLLHDIGRQYGTVGVRHIILGHRLLEEMGADENAKICLTHSFPNKNGKAYTGNNDCTVSENIFLEKYLEDVTYDDYDRLIQLCDGISMPEGPVILEKRLVESAIRNGINEYTIDKWKSYIMLKEYFDSKCGGDIYKLF